MDLVVAVYNENIDWINLIKNKRIFLYLKNPDRYDEIQTKFPNAIIEILPNIGRESHTYVYHISKNYDYLANHTVFLQGNPFDHCRNVLELLEPADIKFFGRIHTSDENGNPDHSGLPLSELYMELFGKTQFNFTIEAGAQFMI